MTDQLKNPVLPEPVKEPKPNKLKDWTYFLLDIAKMLVLYFLIGSVIAKVRVENISMYPTLKEGEVLIVNKLAYRLGSIERGDIVTFHYPLVPQLDYIKRAIGLPGDEVEIRDKKVIVNGFALSEPYLVTLPEYDGKWTVPVDSIFVLGDNRNDSSDSHVWGFVPLSDIIGKALAVYWPLNHIRLLTHPNVVVAAGQ